MSNGAAASRGGGHNKKTLDEHLLDGTYRRDRHGDLGHALLDWKAKPPGKVRAGPKSQRRWCRTPGDEQAVRNGCRFNERLAEHVRDFFPAFLCHSQGREWAGKPFHLSDQQLGELIYPLFGWVRPDGLRRFRRTYIEMPKKVGKSTVASGIGLYMLTADGEPGAQVFSLGSDGDQAKIVHDEAIRMVDASEKLAGVLKVNRSTGNISYPATNSFYRALAGSWRGKSGHKIHCGIVDELHEWYGNKVWNLIRFGYRTRTEPMEFVITNAGDDLESVCYRQREKAQAILKGSMFDDSFFPLIYSVDLAAAEGELATVKEGGTELPVAERCTPGLGTIVKKDELLRDIQDAIQTPSSIPNLLRFTYGVWATGSDNPLLNAEHWAACAEEYIPEDLYGRECYGGLDLSQVNDLTAYALVFPDDERGIYRQLVWHWLPKDTVERERHVVDYPTWAREGWLAVIPGPVIDNAWIEKKIMETSELYDLRELAYDAMYAEDLTGRLEDKYNICRVKIPQTIVQLAGPTAEYERNVIAGTLKHNNNPLLTWQAGHVSYKTDPSQNKRPVKPGSANDHRKIDGIVAGVMALGRAAVRTDTRSVYETRGAIRARI